MKITNVRWPRTNRPGAHSLSFHCDSAVWRVELVWPGMGGPPDLVVTDTYGRTARLTKPARSAQGAKQGKL